MAENITHISRRRVLQAAGATGVVGAFGTQSASAQERGPLERHIVGVEPGQADIARQRADEAYRVLDFGDIGMAVSGWYPDEALEDLERNPNVRYIEAEGVMEAIDHATDEDGGDPSEEQVLPWGIDRVDADVAHHDGETGGGSSVSIIDTGIDPTHETLAVTGGEAFVDCHGGGCTEDWDDDHGHGTHCAGTADALGNDSGVVGVATEADLYAVKVLDSRGSGTWSDVAAGIEWTADQGIDVGSFSLGGGHSETVQDACEYAYGEGTLLVAAAGNSGPDEDSVGYPAAYEECIAVSATDENDDIANFSSRGEEIELAAPGVDVLSSLPGDDYDEWSGTSMACPHVSGAGAQLMANGYLNTDARGQLNDTAEDISLNATEQGNGLLDVAAALGIEEDDDGEENDEEEESLAVETRDATDVGESSATLNGELTELESHGEATVYFEWGESGEDLSNATNEQTLSSIGSFEKTVEELDSGTEYEFHAVAETDEDSDEGEVLTFTTEDGDDENTAPVIDNWEVSTRTTGPWFRAESEWEVSDDDGNLDSVTTEMLDGDSVVDSETSDVSGSSASGEHEVRTRDDANEVRLTVTDEEGESTSDTEAI